MGASAGTQPPTVDGVTTADVLPAAAELELRRRDRIRYQADPVGFARHWLGLDLTPEQEQVLASVRDEPRTIVKAAHAVGKSFVAAVVVCWWIECFDGSQAVTTAPTYRQVQTLLWKELRVRHRDAPRALRGEILQGTPYWRVAADHSAIGKTSDDEEGMKGDHTERLLFVMDEAAGCQAFYWTAAASMLKGGRARLLAIGNPTTVSGPYFDAFHDKSAINATTTVAAYSHPNVLTGLEELGISWETFKNAPVGTYRLPDSWDDPIPGAVSLADLDLAKIELMGVGSPLWNVQVEGRFPSADDRALVSLPWVDAARDLGDGADLREDGRWAGLDVARFGSDRSVLVRMVDGVVVDVDVWQGRELSETAGKAAEAIGDGFTVNVDGAGIGAAISSHLKDAGFKPGRDFHEIQVGARAPTPGRFPKLRDEVWGQAAALLRDGSVSLAGLAEHRFRDLRAELTAVTYTLDPAGRVRIEGKDEMKKRAGRSPDVADAFNLAVWRQPVRRASWEM